MQVHTYRFNGHSPADLEHERGRKDEKNLVAQEKFASLQTSWLVSIAGSRKSDIVGLLQKLWRNGARGPLKII